MHVLDMNSEAGEFLALAFKHLDEVYKISFDFRGENGVAIKINERMWTSTLSTNA